MRWSIVGLVFLAITWSAVPALSQTSSSGAHYCTGIPEDVKSHCAKVLIDNYKRSLKTIKEKLRLTKESGANVEILSDKSIFEPSRILKLRENPLTEDQNGAIEKARRTIEQRIFGFSAKEPMESIHKEQMGKMGKMGKLVAKLPSRDVDIRVPWKKAISYNSEAFLCTDDHRKCQDAGEVGRIGCLVALLACWAAAIS